MKTFTSKIGLEIVIPLLLILGWSYYDKLQHPKWISIASLALVVGFIVYVFTSIKYTIIGTKLNVRGGFMVNTDIYINSIQKIEKTFNILASPAASLDRIEIKYSNGQTILLSPKYKKEFVEELLKINPNIEVKY